SGIVVEGLSELRNRGTVQPAMTLILLGRGIQWEAQLFHPKVKKNAANIQVHVRIFKDGVLKVSMEPNSLTLPAIKGPIALPLSGSVLLDNEAEPGEYVMQLAVLDENDKSKMATQAIVFKVAP